VREALAEQAAAAGEGARALRDDAAAQRVLAASKDAEADALRREVAHWKRTCDAVSKDRQQKDEALRALQRQIEASDGRYEERLSEERRTIRSHADKTIEALRAKTQELLALSQTTTDALAEAEGRNKVLSTKNAQITIERDQLRARIASMGEECDRQKSLTSTRLKAVSLASETNCRNQIEEAKAQFELDKRRIFAAAANLFRQFYNPRNELNDAEFTRLLTRAAEELARSHGLELAIRRLLGIDLSESPEAAISKLIHAACHKGS
jgi:hypothetical protein